MPKRKLDDVEAEDGEEREAATSEDSNSSVHTNSSTDVPSAHTSKSTKGGFTHVRRGSNRRVKFKGVTVFYFQRKQGFICVPSQGGSTLGMGEEHMTADSFSIREFAKHQRQLHLDILAQQRGAKLMGTMMDSLNHRSENPDGSTGSSNGDSESSMSSDEELNVDDYYFLQPVPTRQRRLMLRQAGIKKIDTYEKEECKDIRSSRESCGCDCRVYCEPETCACSLAGIKCQVDRLSFPCGCSKDGCGNVSGRIEFNPIRVRTHFIHTLMRLEMDKKQEEEHALRDQRQKEHGPTRAESSPVCPELVTDPDPPGPSSTSHDTEDVVSYNSNERGSCCDCQNSDIHKFMMHESQFNSGGNSAGTSRQQASSSVEYHATTDNGRAEPSGSNIINSTESGEKGSPQVLLFNDSDDEYSGENSATLYPFTKEDSSYSESSDCSSETSISENDHTTASTFPNFTADNPGYDSTGIVDPAAQESGFCIPSSSSVIPDQKFMDITDPGTSYKLEPISEILNPVRFPGYSGGQVNTAWPSSSPDSYSNFACTEPNSEHGDAVNTYSDADVTPKSQSTYVSYNIEAAETRLNPELPPASAQLPEQYLEPPLDESVNTPARSPLPQPLNNGHTETNGEHLADPIEENNQKSYHELTNSSPVINEQKSKLLLSDHPVGNGDTSGEGSVLDILPADLKHTDSVLEDGDSEKCQSNNASALDHGRIATGNGGVSPCQVVCSDEGSPNGVSDGLKHQSVASNSEKLLIEKNCNISHAATNGQSQNEADSKFKSSLPELSSSEQEAVTKVLDSPSKILTIEAGTGPLKEAL